MTEHSQEVSSEEEARRVAEESRQSEWSGRTFVRELFLGNFGLPLVHPFPAPESDDAEFARFYSDLERFLKNEVDSVEIDQTGEYPEQVVDGLRKLGAFGIKIPKEYGGLGFSVSQYCKTMELIGSYDGNLIALLSAHQSIGVPQPIKLFGTPEQKQKYLPRCAKGAISAFALTEPDVGSDPAKLAATAELSEDGTHYVLNGVKLWCTNGTVADLMVVMARHPDSKKISAFVVEGDSEGFSVETRCHFMGLRALANGLLKFENVKVPVENRLGREGDGLRIAFTTLNAGRLSIPSAVSGGSQLAVTWVREFARDRVQWGVPVGKHEAVSHMLSDVVTNAWVIQSVARLGHGMADRKGYDIRLEAAACKEWCTTRHWDLVDTAIQIKGGRGYETEWSLQNRGEEPTALERMMRDARINRIFEGSSEVMHLFEAREALDKHLKVAGDFVNPKAPMGKKLAALPKMIAFYALWYPSLWVGLTFLEYRGNPMGKHLRYIERATKRLARAVFHGMVRYQAGLERKQGVLFRAVEVANELFAMSAVISRGETMKEQGDPEADKALELADVFCRSAERRIHDWLRDMWKNDDPVRAKLGRSVIEGRHEWVEAELDR